MAGTQRLLSIAAAFLMMNNSVGSTPEALGIVAQATHASLGAQDAPEGTTIYDGDRLMTGAEGSLRLLVGEATLNLPAQSAVILHRSTNASPEGFEAQLLYGAATLSAATRNKGAIIFSSARIRGVAETRSVVQVRVAGPHELILFAQRGPAEISYREETATVEDGRCYRVLLNDPQDAASSGQAPQKQAKLRNAMIFVAVGAAVAAGVILSWRAEGKGAESPDHP
jgi:hypothetical protein